MTERQLFQAYGMVYDEPVVVVEPVADVNIRSLSGDTLGVASPSSVESNTMPYGPSVSARTTAGGPLASWRS